MARSDGARRLTNEPTRLRQVGVDQQIDPPLPIKRDILGTVPGYGAESYAAQHPSRRNRIGRGKLDELEAIPAHGILLLSPIDDRHNADRALDRGDRSF